MAKRANSKATKTTRANQIVRELKAFHKFGRKVLAASKGAVVNKYATGVSLRLAERFGVRRDYTDNARRFARLYSESDLEELCRERTRDGLPLTRNHVVQLTLATDRASRKKLQARAIQEEWSIRDLVAAVRAERYKAGKPKGKSGRLPKIPDSPPEIAQQVQRYCDQWLRWSRVLGLKTDDDEKPKLKKAFSGVRQRVAMLDKEIQALHKVAGKLLAKP